MHPLNGTRNCRVRQKDGLPGPCSRDKKPKGMVDRNQDAPAARRYSTLSPFLRSSSSSIMLHIVSRTCSNTRRPILISAMGRTYTSDAKGPNHDIIEMLTRSEPHIQSSSFHRC